MSRALFLIFFLGLVWILLSGHYTPLLLAFGAVSCLIVWFLSHKMDLVDHEGHPLHLQPIKLFMYWSWLCAEVVKSNFDVALRIIKPSLPIRPRVFTVRTTQRTELGQVIYANSITLTPGTVSIDLRGHEIEVHALAEDPANSLLTGDMDRRITAVERPQPEDPKAGQR
ncbi:MAG: Na+/H+ antiporter subunit E [Arenicellales bacterium]|nr:Na+/H+ antiporter subunit E [Arenicellales bacterium]